MITKWIEFQVAEESIEFFAKVMAGLESESKGEIKYWLMIGPTVFIVGLLFGLSTRKKKSSSLLWYKKLIF